MAGLGNIYVDESLFRAQIHPLSPCGDISLAKTKILLRHIQAVFSGIDCSGAGHQPAITKNWMELLGNFKSNTVCNRRTGEPCYVCGNAIDRMVLGGPQHSLLPPLPGEVKNTVITSNIKLFCRRLFTQFGIGWFASLHRKKCKTCCLYRFLFFRGYFPTNAASVSYSIFVVHDQNPLTRSNRCTKSTCISILSLNSPKANRTIPLAGNRNFFITSNPQAG